jgi:hypothetical protein
MKKGGKKKKKTFDIREKRHGPFHACRRQSESIENFPFHLPPPPTPTRRLYFRPAPPRYVDYTDFWPPLREEHIIRVCIDNRILLLRARRRECISKRWSEHTYDPLFVDFLSQFTTTSTLGAMRRVVQGKAYLNWKRGG